MTKYLRNTKPEEMNTGHISSTQQNQSTHHRYIRYGEPGGGQKAAECGWLVTKWLMEHYKLIPPLRSDLDAAARKAQKEEKQLKTWPKQTVPPYYDVHGNYNITAMMQVLKPYGELEYLNTNTPTKIIRAYFVHEKQRKHYHIYLPSHTNETWTENDSLRKPVIHSDNTLEPHLQKLKEKDATILTFTFCSKLLTQATRDIAHVTAEANQPIYKTREADLAELKMMMLEKAHDLSKSREEEKLTDEDEGNLGRREIEAEDAPIEKTAERRITRSQTAATQNADKHNTRSYVKMMSKNLSNTQ